MRLPELQGKAYCSANISATTKDNTTKLVCAGIIMEPCNAYGDDFAATTEGPDRLEFDSSHAKNIWVYGSPLIIAIGTVGNLLSAVVMTRPNLRKLTATLYLAVLAAVDTLVLYIGLLRQWMLNVFGTDVRDHSIAVCRIHSFVIYLAIEIEPWVIVCVGIERVVAIYFPHKAKQTFTRRFAAFQMAIIGVILAGVNSYFYWTVTLVKGRCTTSNDQRYRYVDKEISPWIVFCLASLIPFLIMLVTNSAIAAKLIHANYVKKVRLNVGNDPKLTSITVLLLSINIIFLLTTAPLTVLIITFHSRNDPLKYPTRWAIFNLLFYMNYSINFLLYCLSVPRFRRELRRMCRRNTTDTRMPAHNVWREPEAEVDARL